MDKKEYKQYVDERAKRSKTLLNCIKAFVSGGLVCVFGQALFHLYDYLGVSEDNSKLLVSVTLIFIAGLFTGLGFFDCISKFCGAGLLVPITGFANSIAAAAIDNKNEGFITGVGAKMFIIAGPVLVYGISFSVVYGIIYYFFV